MLISAERWYSDAYNIFKKHWDIGSRQTSRRPSEFFFSQNMCNMRIILRVYLYNMKTYGPRISKRFKTTMYRKIVVLIIE